ncbi:MAG: hypothetical protein ACWGSD_04385 [Thermodesulfobacteriota bacterium]
MQRYSASLEAFLEEVSAALTELEQERLPLTASMKKRPDEILSMLPQVLSFEQMSFLEVRYALPGTARKRPGIRFWLEGPLREKRLRAILFEDTAVWNVSYDLVKLYTELGTFFLQGTEIVGCPAAALSAGSGTDVDWKVLLRTVLRAPLP